MLKKTSVRILSEIFPTFETGVSTIGDKGMFKRYLPHYGANQNLPISYKKLGTVGFIQHFAVDVHNLPHARDYTDSPGRRLNLQSKIKAPTSTT